MIGISTLIGWNAILTALDFFQTNFSFVNISFTIGVPYGLGLNIFGLALVFLSKYVTLKVRIIFGFTIMTIFMILMPIESYLWKESVIFTIFFTIITFLKRKINILFKACWIMGIFYYCFFLCFLWKYWLKFIYCICSYF